jgi:predicted nucleotidyltransferase
MPIEQDLRTAERIRDRIRDAAGDEVERILFYGSRVTGRPDPSGDYDILVVLRAPVPDWTAPSLQMSDLFSAFECPVDVQVFGLTEFEESRPVAGTVAYAADRHGVPLHAKLGTAQHVMTSCSFSYRIRKTLHNEDCCHSERVLKNSGFSPGALIS